MRSPLVDEITKEGLAFVDRVFGHCALTHAEKMYVISIMNARVQMKIMEVMASGFPNIENDIE